jgi:hypothetical protein
MFWAKENDFKNYLLNKEVVYLFYFISNLPSGD